MEFIYGYIKNICVFTLVITLILNIFPDKKYKKYIKLFAGLLLLALIFSPIVKFKKDYLDIEQMISKYAHGSFHIDLEEGIGELETKMYERIQYEYKKDNGD